jgi:hypothetical protein
MIISPFSYHNRQLIRLILSAYYPIATYCPILPLSFVAIRAIAPEQSELIAPKHHASP